MIDKTLIPVGGLKKEPFSGLSLIHIFDNRSGLGINFIFSYKRTVFGCTPIIVDMLEYYSTTCPFNHSVDELIELIAFLLRNADHQRNA